MNSSNLFRLPSTPSLPLRLASKPLDAIDAHPVLALAVIVCAVAGLLLAFVH